MGNDLNMRGDGSNTGALPAARATHEPSPDGLGHSVGVPNVERLTFDDRGDLHLWLVWALKPGQPQIIAVCTDEATAERYKPIAPQIVPGSAYYVEECIANHLFGNRDVQSSIYRAANMRGGAA